LPWYYSLKTCVYRIIIKVDPRRHPIKTSLADYWALSTRRSGGGRTAAVNFRLCRIFCYDAHGPYRSHFIHPGRQIPALFLPPQPFYLNTRDSAS
jgi:hypothetical protein